MVKVVAGQLGVVLEDERRVLGPDEQVLILPGTPHTFWNGGEGELRLSEIGFLIKFNKVWKNPISYRFGSSYQWTISKDELPNT